MKGPAAALRAPARRACRAAAANDADTPALGYVRVVEHGRRHRVIGGDQGAEFDKWGASAGVQEAVALQGRATRPRRSL